MPKGPAQSGCRANWQSPAPLCWGTTDSRPRSLTLELSGRRRYDARARAEKMDEVPQPGPWWHAVGAPLERLVRPHRAWAWPSRSALPAAVWQDFRPPCLSCCRRGQCRPRRPNELANDHSCPRSAVLRFSKVAPCNCLRASSHCRCGRDLPSAQAVPVPPEHTARTGRAVPSCRAHRPFSVVQVTPTGADFAGAPHGLFCEA